MYSLSQISKSKKAFSLLETVISIGIFVIFAMAIYTSIQYIYKVVYSSRIQIIETAILNEQVELVRNMKFSDVGIVLSTPVGILQRNSTTTRDNIEFLITRSIRDIDNPSDGTLETGTDSNPNDFKFAFFEVRCAHCKQVIPLSISTYLADSFPEDASNTGALFVYVQDSNNHPVQGANIHVSSTVPGIDKKFDETTDNSGVLKIYNLPVCYQCYEVSVNKLGLTTDQTSSSTDFAGSIPVNEHITINDRQVSTSYLKIDVPAQATVKTFDMTCLPVPNVSFDVTGGGILATNPDVNFFQDLALSTNVDGEYNFDNNLHWGSYNFVVTSNYNFVGSIPNFPVNILANSTQTINLLITTSTPTSLSVRVQDNVTKSAISGAKVTLNSGGVDYIKYTGLGYERQNDWSGGYQEFYDINHGYGSIDGIQYDTTIKSPFGLKLASTGQDAYISSGELVSATFDFGSTDVSYVKLDWQPHIQPALAGNDPVYFQIATSNSSTPEFWDFLGPDGTSFTHYSLTDQDINKSINDGKRYLRYKLFLYSADTRYTPSISEVNIFYVKSCSLPGRVYFEDNLVTSGNTLTIEANGYETRTITDMGIDGNIATTTDLIISP